MHLLGGIPFTPFVIGAVGFAQVIKLINDRDSNNEKGDQVPRNTEMKLSIRGSMLTGHDFKDCFRRTSVLDFWEPLSVFFFGERRCNHRILHGLCCQKKFKSEEPLLVPARD